jgi:hypothetical protein
VCFGYYTDCGLIRQCRQCCRYLIDFIMELNPKKIIKCCPHMHRKGVSHFIGCKQIEQRLRCFTRSQSIKIFKQSSPTKHYFVNQKSSLDSRLLEEFDRFRILQCLLQEATNRSKSLNDLDHVRQLQYSICVWLPFIFPQNKQHILPSYRSSRSEGCGLNEASCGLSPG